MVALPPEAERRLILRLRRIEGQARGIVRMVREGRDCREVLEQLAALQAAARQAFRFASRAYLQACAAEEPGQAARALQTLLAALERLP